VWPVSVRSSWPLAESQSLMVLSSLPEASVSPSGENATEIDGLGLAGQRAQQRGRQWRDWNEEGLRGRFWHRNRVSRSGFQ
jgi:hypothetical protein